MLERIYKRLERIVRRLDWTNVLVYLCLERFRHLFASLLRQDLSKEIYTLTSKDSRHPLLCRFNLSDRAVFGQIFLDREYAMLDHIVEPEYIVDCGAYVGYSSAYLLSRFPAARLVAVEPAADNFTLLQHNLAPYGERVIARRSAIWSHTIEGVVRRGDYRDGLAWSTQVVECAPGDLPDVAAIDIGTLMVEAGFPRIDVLKIDIERAEAIVFAANYEQWIDKVGIFLIELHDDECRAVFTHALRNGQYRFAEAGEITIAQRVA